MEVQSIGSLVIIPLEDLNLLKTTQQEILLELKALKGKKPAAESVHPQHITAKEFMVAVKICRSKFDQLVATRKIQVIKKKRKIYVPLQEVNRYFTDPSIQ